MITKEQLFAAVCSPSHYTDDRDVEPVQVIEDWNLPYHLASVLHYISRYPRKGNEFEQLMDLAKAWWYIDRFLELEIRRVNGKQEQAHSGGTEGGIGFDTKSGPVRASD
jgi:hypothetical protein